MCHCDPVMTWKGCAYALNSTNPHFTTTALVRIHWLVCLCVAAPPSIYIFEKKKKSLPACRLSASPSLRRVLDLWFVSNQRRPVITATFKEMRWWRRQQRGPIKAEALGQAWPIRAGVTIVTWKSPGRSNGEQECHHWHQRESTAPPILPNSQPSSPYLQFSSALHFLTISISLFCFWNDKLMRERMDFWPLLLIYRRMRLAERTKHNGRNAVPSFFHPSDSPLFLSLLSSLPLWPICSALTSSIEAQTLPLA